MSGPSAKPEVRHVYQNHHLDSTRWEHYTPRADDVVISTAYKAGTTFMQTIVANLIFHDGAIPDRVQTISPWVDLRVSPVEEMAKQIANQTHRRFLKTHLALDGIAFFEEVRYIVVGRDPRDVFMSLLNHYESQTPTFYEVINRLPGRVGPPLPEYPGDVLQLWNDWIGKSWFDWESDGYPYWSMFHHAQTWWDFRHLPNILFVHYADLLADLEGEMKRVARFLDMEIPVEAWPRLVEACRFETVKKNPDKVMSEMAGVIFKDGAQSFLHKGTNGRWRDVLGPEQQAQYEATAARTLSADCARWLEDGRLPDPSVLARAAHA